MGSGHSESVYHRAMEFELRENNIKYESEVVTPIIYKECYVGYGRADIVVNKNLIIELKALTTNSFKSNEIARLRTYMTSLGIESGIMINFPQFPTSGKCIIQHIT